MLELPDSVEFEHTPYGVPTETPLFLVNDGPRLITLTLRTSGPFDVSPPSVAIRPMSSQQVTLSCSPTELGPNHGSLHVAVDSAHHKTIALRCTTYVAQLFLERTTLAKFPKTLVTHTATDSVELHNKSEAVVDFQLMAWPAPQGLEDPPFSDLRLPFSFFPTEGRIYPSSKCTLVATFQPAVSGAQEATAWISSTGSKERLPIKLRALAVGPVVEFDCDVLNFKRVVIGSSGTGQIVLTNFSEIEVAFHLVDTAEEPDPAYNIQYDCIAGVIPPNSSIQITISFTPHVLRKYTIQSIWAVLGLAQCLVVELTATAVPPNVSMTCLTDSLTESHVRTIVSDRRLRRRMLDEWAGRLSVYYEDEQHDGEYPSVLSREYLAINNIDKTRILDFGLVAFSFSSSKELYVQNQSQLSCEFALKVEPSTWAMERGGEGNCDRKQDQYLACSDLTVSPSEIRLEPGEDMHVSLTILPKRRAGFYKDLVVNLYHASTSIPLQVIDIIGSVVNPKFEITPAVVNISEGYVGFRHTFSLTMRNISSVVGRWSFPTQEVMDNCQLACSKTSGVLLPDAEEALECSVIPRAAGHLVVPVEFTSDSFEKQTLSCMVQYNAGGPQVESSCARLDFTKPGSKDAYVRVLELKTVSFTLTNVGLTDARCRAVAEKQKSCFSIGKDYNDTVLAAGESTTVVVNFYSSEAGTYKDTLLIYVTLTHPACTLSNETIKATSSVLRIPMHAVARGTNLMCPDQDLVTKPDIDCGTWFVNEELHYELRIENHGPEAQNCTWSFVGNPGVKKTEAIRHLSFVTDKASIKPGEYFIFRLKGSVDGVLENGAETYILKSNVPGKETKTAFQVTFQYSFINVEVALAEVILPENLGYSLAPIYTEPCRPIEIAGAAFLERPLTTTIRTQAADMLLSGPSASVPGTSLLSTRSAMNRTGTARSTGRRLGRQSVLNFVYEEFPVVASPDYFIQSADQTAQFYGAQYVPLSDAPPVPLLNHITPEGVYAHHELTRFIRVLNTSTLPGRIQVIAQSPFQVRVFIPGGDVVPTYMVETMAIECGLARVFGVQEDALASASPRALGGSTSPMADRQSSHMSTRSDSQDLSMSASDIMSLPEFGQSATICINGNAQDYCIVEVSVDLEYLRSTRDTKLIESSLLIRLLPLEQTPISVPTITLPMHLSAFFPSLEFHVCPQSMLDACGQDVYQAFEQIRQNEEKSVVDFGTANVGTTLTRIILCQNRSRFPVRFHWTLQVPHDVDRFSFDLSPLGVDFNAGLLPGAVARFQLSFIGQSNELNTTGCKAICTIDGGESYAYDLNAGTSNLEADIRPSSINYGDIFFLAVQQSTLSVHNRSPIPTTVVLSFPLDCRPFITHINGHEVRPSTSPDASSFTFQLEGSVTLDIHLTVNPRIPGVLYIPLSVKIGHLQEYTIPISASVYIDRPVVVSGTEPVQGAHNCIPNMLTRMNYLFPWDNNATGQPTSSLPPYSVFLVAAVLYIRHIMSGSINTSNESDGPVTGMPLSTLQKRIGLDGSLEIYGQLYAPTQLEDIKNPSCLAKLQTDYVVCSIADDLVLNFIEYYRYYGTFPIIAERDLLDAPPTGRRSRNLSIARTRLLSPSVAYRRANSQAAFSHPQKAEAPVAEALLAPVTYYSEGFYRYLRVKDDTAALAQKHILFNVTVRFPAAIRGSRVSQVVTLVNHGSVPLHISFDKRFLTPLSITVEPERISRLPSGEAVTFTISFATNYKMALGDYLFLVPMNYKQQLVGFLSCMTTVTLPTIRPLNLSACASNFATVAVKETEAYTLNFGEVYFGRAKQFTIRFENPTLVPASYTLDISSGVVGAVPRAERYTFSLGTATAGQDGNIFSVISDPDKPWQNYGTLLPKASDLLFTLSFKPIDYFASTAAHATYFRGALTFAVKMGGNNGNAAKVVVHLVGVGIHPHVTLDVSDIRFAPIFPKTLPGAVAVATLRNDSDQPWEVYLREYDRCNYIEQIAYQVAARNYGRPLMVDKKNRMTGQAPVPDETEGDVINPAVYRFRNVRADRAPSKPARTGANWDSDEPVFSYLCAAIPGLGSEFPLELQTLLSELELDSLTHWYHQNYVQPTTEPPVVDLTPTQTPAQTPADKSAAPSALSNATAQATESLKLSACEEEEPPEDELARYYDCVTSQDDFAYDISPIEELYLRYSRYAPTVVANRSYRASSTDVCLSNLPFLVFLVHGPPLAGKTTLSKRLSEAFDPARTPCISLEQILGSCEVAIEARERQSQWKVAQQQAGAPAAKGAPKKKVEDVPDVDPLRAPEYITALADHLYRQIMTEHGITTNPDATEGEPISYAHELLGLVFDSLACSAVCDAGDAVRVIASMCTRYFMKPFVYGSQTFSSRLLFHTFVLDCSPLEGRRRALNILVTDYHSAELARPTADESLEPGQPAVQGAEKRLSLIRQALVVAKKSYDEELSRLTADTSSGVSEEAIPVEAIEKKEDPAADPEPREPEQLFKLPYTKVYFTDDAHGAAHSVFITDVDALNTVLPEVRSSVREAHITAVDAYRVAAGNKIQRTPEEIEYQEALNSLEQARVEFAAAKKADQKKFQQAIDDAETRIAKLRETLPPHPTAGIREDNIFGNTYFTSTYLEELETLIGRFKTAYTRYSTVINQKLANLRLYSSVHAPAGAGSFKEFLHVRSTGDFFHASAIRRIFSIIFEAAEHRRASLDDTSDSEMSQTTNDTRDSTASPALNASGRMRTRTNPLSALAKMLTKLSKTTNFPLLKNAVDCIVNQSHLSPQNLLADIYNPGVFNTEDASTFKRIARVIPANSAAVKKFLEARETITKLEEEIRAFSSLSTSRSDNPKARQQLLTEKQSQLSAAQNALTTLLSNTDPVADIGATRWIIPPGETVCVGLRFVSNSVLTTKLKVHFAIRGSDLVLPLICDCRCDYPHIAGGLLDIFPTHTAGTGKRVIPLPENEPSPEADTDEEDGKKHQGSTGLELFQHEHGKALIGYFTFGYLRSGMQRPNFFSVYQEFTHPFELPEDVSAKPVSRGGRAQSNVSNRAPQQSSGPDSARTDPEQTTVLNQLDILTHQTACRTIADGICRFTPQHVEVLSIANDSYFDVTVALFFDTMVPGLVEGEPQPDAEAGERTIDFDAPASVAAIEECFQKVYQCQDTSIPLTDVLTGGGGTDKKKAPPPAKGKAPTEQQPVFFAYPYRLVLKPGERSAVYITCFPNSDGRQRARLLIGVEHNPTYLLVSMLCVGQTPTIRYVLPECAEDLLPCGTASREVEDLGLNIQKYLANGRKLDPKDIVSGAKGAKPGTTKTEDHGSNQPTLLIPRVPTGVTEMADITVTNTSKLAVLVEYLPLHKDLSMLSAVTAAFSYSEYAVKHGHQTIRPPKSDRILDQTFSYTVNGSLTLSNSRFYLGPGESGTMKVAFCNKEDTKLALPGCLSVRQHVGGLKNVPENNDEISPGRLLKPPIPSLQTLARTFLQPVEEFPLSIVCESHTVSVYAAVANIPTSPDRIPVQEAEHPPSDTPTVPTNLLNFGIVRAQVYFRAELVIVNNGPYQVGFRLAVAKAYRNIVHIIKDSEPADPKQAAKKGQPVGRSTETDPDKLTLVATYQGLVDADSTASDGKGPLKTSTAGKKPALGESSNIVPISILFRAPEAVVFDRAAVLQIVFFEPSTNSQLARSHINLSAEAVFSVAKIQPERNIVFGDHAHGRVLTKKVMVTNEGHFPFIFSMEPLVATLRRWLLTGSTCPFGPAYSKAVEASGLDSATFNAFKVSPEPMEDLFRACQDAGLIAGGNDQKAAKGKPAAPSPLLTSLCTLVTEPFIASPTLFQLGPKESCEITITFSSRLNEHWRNYFTIDYTSRPPDYHGGSLITEAFLDSLTQMLDEDVRAAPPALQNYLKTNEGAIARLASLQQQVTTLPLLRFSIGATSIVPGIVSTNYTNIFEEQALTNHLPPNPGMLAGGPAFSSLTKTLCLGPCVIGSSITERIKLTNPYAVPCTIVAFLNFDTAKMSSHDVDGLIAAHIGETSTQVARYLEEHGQKDQKKVASQSEKRAPTAPSQATKGKGDKDKNVVTNDSEAWTLGSEIIHLNSHESTYLTITYSPSSQVVSKCEVVCVVVDNHLAVVELIKENLPGIFGLNTAPTGQGAKNVAKGTSQDHIVLQQLEDGISDTVAARRRLFFTVEAAGVLPEVIFGPDLVNLGKVTVAASDDDIKRVPIYVQNTGRVDATYAIVITADTPAAANCFTISKARRSNIAQEETENGEKLECRSPQPQSKLFTGLVTIPPGTKDFFDIGPSLADLAAHANGEIAEARVGLKVMTKASEYTVVDVPLQCTVVSACLSALETGFPDRAIQTLYEDTLTLLFNLVGNPKARQAANAALAEIAGSKAFEGARAYEIDAYGSFFVNPTVTSRTNVFLRDLPLNLISDNTNDPPEYMTKPGLELYATPVTLYNPSVNHIRFEFNEDICRRLGVIVHPAVGHIHAGTKKVINIRLTRPASFEDFVAIFNAAGGKGAPKGKGPTGAYGSTVLFGTPLICRYYCISYKPGARINDWDMTHTVVSYTTTSDGVAVRQETVTPEPEFQPYLEEDEVRTLLEQSLASQREEVPAKGKTPAKNTQPDRTAALSNVLKDLHNHDNRVAIASAFLELNLFGVAADYSAKYYGTKGASELELITPIPDPVSKYGVIDYPIVSTPILQKSTADFYAYNDSYVSPVLEFTINGGGDSPYHVAASDGPIIAGKPDLLVSAVKETYGTIADIPGLAPILAKFGVNAKGGADKNALATFQASYTALNPQTNRYLKRYLVTYEPRIPGRFQDQFTGSAGNVIIMLTATATLPLCRLECESNSTYLQKQRHGSLKTPQLFTNLICSNPKLVTVIEITGQGVGVTVTGHINVLSCINQPYDVTLQRLPESSSTISTTFGEGGRIQPGETSIIRFTYTPVRESARLGIEESFFVLRIPEHDVVLPLLVVGRFRDPEVVVSSNKLTFDPILVGESATQEITLRNCESYPMNYRFRPAPPSPETEADSGLLSVFQCTITPSAGILQPHSTTSVLFNVQPTCEGRVNQLVRVEISRRATPIHLNIKYEAFFAKHSLSLMPFTSAGLPQQLGTSFDLDFGTVFLSDYRVRVLKLQNDGSHDIAYSCRILLDRNQSTARRDTVEMQKVRACLSYEIQCNDEKDKNSTARFVLAAGKAAMIALRFQPTLDIALTQDFGLFFQLSVEGASRQRIRLLGRGLRPGLHTTASNVNFGTVLCALRHENCHSRTLTFTNRDTQPLSIEYMTNSNAFFVDTPPMSDALPVGRTKDVAIRFVPSYAGKFKDTLLVMVNGLYKLRFPLAGVAVNCSFTVADYQSGAILNSYSSTSSQHAVTNVNLGSVTVGNPPMIRAINLCNKNNTTATFQVMLNESASDEVPRGLFIAIVPTEQYPDYYIRCIDSLTNWENRKTKYTYLTELPSSAKLAPNQPCTIFFMYSPIARTAPFQVYASVAVENSIFYENIFAVRGAVLGASAKLNNQSVELPVCITKSFVQRSFFIENTGDMELRYRIPLPPHGLAKRALVDLFENETLTLSPTSGFIPVGSTVTINVRFSPSTPGRYYIPAIPIECELEGTFKVVGEANVRCIAVDKDGIKAEAQATDITFSCNARETTSAIARIDNTTESTFVVRTILDGPDAVQFQVPERLSIPVGGMDFKIVYNPLLQPKEGEHRAELYIAGADGGANVWRLHGKVGAPLDEGVVTNLTEAAYAELLKGSTVVPKSGKAAPSETRSEIPADFLSVLQKVSNVTTTGVEAWCHQTLTLCFPLRNWEKRMQRFRVSVELAQKELTPLCQIHCTDVVDAPAAGTIRNIEIGFVPMVTDQLFAGTLTFTAYETEEKLVYRFLVQSGGPPTVGKLALETTVRDPVEKLITIPNPLLALQKVTNVTMAAKASRDDLVVTPDKITFSNKASTYSFKVRFNPYVPYDSEPASAFLTFDVSAVLTGVEQTALSPVRYQLNLISYVPRPSSPVKIQADMGTTLPFSISLSSNLPHRPEKVPLSLGLTDVYDISDIYRTLTTRSGAPGKGKDTLPSLIDEKTIKNSVSRFALTTTEIQIETGRSFTVPLTFSPQQFGEHSANLVVYNEAAGFWVVPLLGKCVRPPASGTITVTSG
ncbi:hypothetical protein GMRT_15801 [Giardia muris]|uniref:HYDIN/VesB/CFA65-like Ig-like domain-containing protein n=1 Tax=Giardia muris TaxID=5742 RepID=A0A4Z1T0C9_GIAMU|nr:hypothetical protein GMRT_15801 [Giardia muris]|eukprot:TNJ29158.1 hypothetical protein GMRT_15801 [Giardia muris]